MFDKKSQRRLSQMAPERMGLGKVVGASDEPASPPTGKILAPTRQQALAKLAEGEEEAALFFDDSVPLDIIKVPKPQAVNLGENEVIPMVTKSRMFSWIKIGTKYLGSVQNLLVTWRLHVINPYEYLLDVLQRVKRHSASEASHSFKGWGSSTSIAKLLCFPLRSLSS